MNKLNYKIAIISLLTMTVFSSPAKAAPADLIVEFEQTPLFSEASFLPGDSIVRFIKVTNNTPDSKAIAVEAINKNDPNGLAAEFDMSIKEGGNTLFSGTMSDFFSAGELFLSNLNGGGGQTQYDFSITFKPAGANSLQGKTLGFDFIIGFQGSVNNNSGGSGGGNGGGGGGGGGGGLPPGLSIAEETVTATGADQTSVTVVWDTSYFSTSQIVYAIEGENYTFELTPPNYGYPHATVEDPAKVTNHSVTIDGLTQDTTYRYRVISHASPPSISREYIFKTLAQANTVGQTGTSTGTNSGRSEQIARGVPSGQISRENITGETNNAQFTVGSQNNPSADQGRTGLLALISGLSSNWHWAILLALISLILFLVRKQWGENR